MSKPFCIIDVEATCWPQDDAKTKESEIIEIGAVVWAPDDRRVLADFQTFVRPVPNPSLSEFCRELTSIRQQDVDAAPGFSEAVARMKAAVLESYHPIPGAWGEYDRRQFRQDCKWHKCTFPFRKHWVNVKAMFSEKLRCRPCGLAHALIMLRMEFEGTHHRGLDDARNAVRIMERLL